MTEIKKIVLAYSGGLDTSVILKWLQKKYKVPVIALLADVGQGEDLEDAKKRAVKIGAQKVVVKNLEERFTKTNINKFDAEDAEKYLRASGLSGPIKIRKIEKIIF